MDENILPRNDSSPQGAAHGASGARRLLRRLARDERGSEILEYVLIAGLVIVATIAVVASFGAKVLARWTSVNSSF